MSERRRSLRRKPLADRINAPILSPCPSLKPKPAATPRTRTKTKTYLSNSLTGTGSNDAQELQQQHQNPSVDLPHSSTPQPNHSRASDDAGRPVFDISRTYTQLSTDGKKKREKGKAAAALIPSSCPLVGRFRSFSHEWDKIEGEHGDAVPSKSCLLAHINKNKVMSLVQPYRKWKSDEELEFKHQLQRKLPCDVMEIIFSFLNDWPSRIRFGAVCKAWRWVAQQNTHLKLAQPVWIMLSRYSDSDSRDFFSLSYGGVTHTIHMPEARKMDCCGSSQGWLIMQKYDDQHLNKFILLNPLSKALIPLPLKAKVKSSDTVEYQILPMERVQKVILSAAPDDDCLVAAIDIHGCLYLCRITDCCWTKQHHIKYKNFRYKDVLFYERSTMYGIERANAEYMVLRFMPDLNFKAQRFSLPIRRLIWSDYWYRYLAECCGKVVLVLGVFEEWYYSKISYLVCELESTQDDMYLECYGDGVLLLDHTSCRYLPIKDCDGMNSQGNCIYVTGSSNGVWYNTDSSCEFRYHSVYTKNHENGAFEWEGGIFGSIGSQRSTHRNRQYVWYTPNIQI